MHRIRTAGVLLRLAALCFAFWVLRERRKPLSRAASTPVTSPVKQITIMGGKVGRSDPTWTIVDLHSATDGRLQRLGDLPNVKQLELSGSSVTDAGREHLTELTALKKVELRFTNVTKAGVERLNAALPGCVVLY